MFRLFEREQEEPKLFEIISQEDQEDNYDILVESIVNEVYAETFFKQLYKNCSDHPLELCLNLELINEIQFVDFEVEIEDKKVKSKIIIKEKGEEQYSDSISSGNTGIYVENDEYNRDKYLIHLGNIEPNKTVFIKYHFIQILKSNNLNYIYKLMNSFPSINDKLKPKSMKVKIKFDTIFPIVKFESKASYYNSKIKNKYNDDRAIEVEIMLKESIFYNSDSYDKYKSPISFEFQTKDYEIPKLYKQYDSKNDETSFLFRNFKDFKEINDLEKKESEKNTSGIYYFVFNEKCGLNSDYLKTFLKTFLSLLPEGSYYQIIEYGTCLKLYNIKPLQCSSKNYEKTINKININNSNQIFYNYDHINEVFEYINTYGDNNNSPKFLFILNERCNTENNIFNKIHLNENIKNNCHIYMYEFWEKNNIIISIENYNIISITSYQDPEKSSFHFIQEESLKEMIKNQLYHMSHNIIYDINITNSNNKLLYYFKNDNTYLFIMKGKVNGQIDINNNYTLNGIYYKNKLSFNEKNIVTLNEGDFLAKTIIYNIIQNEINDDETVDNIKKLSKKYKILCKYTSLFGIIENNENTQEGNMQLNYNYIINRSNNNIESLFNNNNNQTSGGLFGNNNNNNQSSRSIFGNNNNYNSRGGLFGNNYNNQNSGSLFGNNNNYSSGGGLFGNNYNNRSSQILFGTNNSQKTEVLFGNNYNNNACNTNLLVNYNNTQTSNGVFSNNNNQTSGNYNSNNSLFGNNRNTQTSDALFANNNNNTQTSGVNNQNEIDYIYNDNLLKEVIKTMDNEGYWNENEYTRKILKMKATIYEKIKKLVNNDKIAITFIILYYILNEVKEEITKFSDYINKAKLYLTKNNNSYEEIKSKLGL